VINGAKTVDLLQQGIEQVCRVVAFKRDLCQISMVMKRTNCFLTDIAFSLAATAQTSAKDTNIVTGIFKAAWMPDGKSILLSAIQFDRSRKRANVTAVILYDLQTKEKRLLINNAADPDVSPDGKLVAFGRNNDIYLYNIKTKEETALLTDTLGESSPTWSPDSKKIAYNVQSKSYLGPRLSVLDIYVVDVNTKQSRKITGGEYKSYNPVWKSKGDKIVYYLEKGDNRDQIYLTNESGSFHRNLTADTATHNFYPFWMNNKIIFTKSRAGLYSINEDGTEKVSFLENKDGKNLFRGFYNATTNQLICLYNDRVHGAEITIYNVKTGKEEVLLNDEQIKAVFD